MLSVVLRFLNVICKNNNSDKDSFSYEYIMIVVTSYFDSNVDKCYKTKTSYVITYSCQVEGVAKSSASTDVDARRRT